MKFYRAFLFVLLTNLPLTAQDFFNWKEGEYTSYHTQWQNGDWEGYLLHVNRKINENTWELDFFHRTSLRDTIVRLNVPIKKEKGNFPAEVVNGKVIRGEEINDLDYNLIIVKIMNMLNLRFVDYKKSKSKKVKKDYCCNINSGNEYEDKWNEFNYSLFHTIDHSVPILGVIQTRKSNADFTTILTSLGRNTNNLSTYTTYPTYIDIHSLYEISFPGFRIKYPSSWILTKVPAKDNNVELFATQLGGNIHAGHLLIKITTDTIEKLNQRLEAVKLTKVFPNHPMGEMMKFENEELDTKGNLFYWFKFQTTGQIGMQLEGYFLNENKTKLAEVILFTNFGAPILDQKYIPKLLSSFDQIAKSFKFTEE